MRLKPINKVLVTLPSAFTEEIVTDSGFRLWKDASYSKEWNATVVGKVAAISDYTKPDSQVISDQLDVDMEVVFDYKVVSDFDFASDSNHFHLVTPVESIYLRKYTSKSGMWINVRAFPGTFGHQWNGWLQDKYLNRIDGAQGTEKDIEKWLAQFTFGKTDKYVFKNQLTVNKQPYWKVAYEQIFAKKVQGVWEAVGDKLLMIPLEVDVTEQVKISMGGIHIPESSLKARFYDRAILLSGGEEMGLQRGDIVAFDEKFLMKYEIEGRDYFLIRKSRINGKWN